MAERRRWRRLGSVRARATLAAVMVLALCYVAAAAAFLVLLRQSLVESLERAVGELAEEVAAEAEQGSLPAALLPHPRGDTFIQVVDAGGSVVTSSLNLSGRPPLALFRPRGSSSVRTIAGRGGRGEDRFVVVAQLARAPGGVLTVYAGSALGPVNRDVLGAGSLLAAGLPLLIGLVGTMTWVLVGRALRPVEAIRGEVADISARDLYRRVPLPPTDDEVARLARTMNAMLDRLESATERQRRFVGDASHELQSPLATLRAELELTAAEGGPCGAVAGRLLGDVDRQERLVRDLLFLAAKDEGAAGPALTLIDLDDVVLAEAARVRTRPSVVVDTTGVSAAPVRGGRDELSRVVRNLLDNAVRHARSRVDVELAVRAGWAVLSVTDDGPGIPDGERSRIFERFARVDSGRSRSQGGTGLGLAIAREVIVGHGGTIDVDDAPVGARLVVRLPASS